MYKKENGSQFFSEAYDWSPYINFDEDDHILDVFCYSQTAEKHNIDNRTKDKHIIDNLKRLYKDIIKPIFNTLVDGQKGREFKVNSVYRCPKLNRKIGGAKKSQHMMGNAIDFEIIGIDNKTLHEWIKREGKKGNIDYHCNLLENRRNPKDPYSGWVHLSYVPGINIQRNKVIFK